MSAKAEISWKRTTEDGEKVQVYAHHVGNRFHAWLAGIVRTHLDGGLTGPMRQEAQNTVRERLGVTLDNDRNGMGDYLMAHMRLIPYGTMVLGFLILLWGIYGVLFLR